LTRDSGKPSRSKSSSPVKAVRREKEKGRSEEPEEEVSNCGR
jgi:hypothetical protein